MIKKKVFIGLTEIASQINQYKKGFENSGYQTLTAVLNRTSYNISETYDFNIPSVVPEIKDKLYDKYLDSITLRLYKKFLWRKAIKECDIFLFIWSSFYVNHKDYAILKKLGKKIITIFVGNDIRWKHAADQEFSMYNLHIPEYNNYFRAGNTLEKKISYLRTVEKYSDLIFSVPNQSQLALRPYYLFNFPICLEDYTENAVQRKIPHIIHAPTNRPVKGTKYIIDVFERLKNEGIEFEYTLLENLSHDQIKRKYFDSDILVGQLFYPRGGKQEIELMAMGKVVLSNISRHYPQLVPINCPVIDVNPDNLYVKLREIILNHEKRIKIARMGRPFVKENNDVNEIVKQFLFLLENKNFIKPDFIPTFFRENIIPVTKNENTIYNKWTNFVKQTEWYKKYVPVGERDNLFF